MGEEVGVFIFQASLCIPAVLPVAVFSIESYSSSCGSDGKEPACSVGDLDSVPELGRFPGGGQVFHSSILPGEFHELFHVVTKIQTQLNDFYDDENMD